MLKFTPCTLAIDENRKSEIVIVVITFVSVSCLYLVRLSTWKTRMLGKTIRKERIRSLKNKGRQGFIDLSCNLHSRGGLLRWCAIFVTGSSFHLFYGLSTQTPSADADRLCGSLCWTTTSMDNSLHDEEEKAEEQQIKNSESWPNF